jgi:hypothetical protein
MPDLISFSGRARHGKDTCAAALVELAREEFGVTVGRFSFAWPLKARVFGEMAQPDALQKVLYDKPPEIRKLLQETGTERGRDVFGENFWTLQAEAMLHLMAEAMPYVKLWVISDCRFPNEVEFVKNGGRVVSSPMDLSKGLALWIDSDRPTLTGEAAFHASEVALDPLDKDTEFDGRINNNTDVPISRLKSQIRPHLRRILLR